MIYVDPIQKHASGEWCHMWSSMGDTDELHAFANKIGLRRDWAQVSSSHIVKEWHHYDLRPSKRVLAIKHGAVEMSLLVWLKEQRIEQKGLQWYFNQHRGECADCAAILSGGRASGKTSAMWEHASRHARSGDVMLMHAPNGDRYFRFDGVKWDEIDVPPDYSPPYGWCTNCKKLPAGSVGGLCDECRPLGFEATLDKHIHPK